MYRRGKWAGVPGNLRKRNFLRDGKNQTEKPPWTVRSRFRGRQYPLPSPEPGLAAQQKARFWRRNGGGKNPDSQGGVRVEIFSRPVRKNTAHPLTVWIGGTDIEQGLFSVGDMLYLYSITPVPLYVLLG